MKIIYKTPGEMSEGDVKLPKCGTRFIRQYVRVYDSLGKCIGREVAHGRPCYEWKRERMVK